MTIPKVTRIQFISAVCPYYPRLEILRHSLRTYFHPMQWEGNQKISEPLCDHACSYQTPRGRLRGRFNWAGTTGIDCLYMLSNLKIQLESRSASAAVEGRGEIVTAKTDLDQVIKAILLYREHNTRVWGAGVASVWFDRCGTISFLITFIISPKMCANPQIMTGILTLLIFASNVVGPRDYGSPFALERLLQLILVGEAFKGNMRTPVADSARLIAELTRNLHTKMTFRIHF